VATPSNATFLLTQNASTGLKWIGGYTESVDWIDSSAVDMIFWSKYLHERKTNRSRKKGKRTDIEMIKSSSSKMKKLMPTVFNEMGFNIYYVDNGGGISTIW
jgi:hypothetical protein